MWINSSILYKEFFRSHGDLHRDALHLHDDGLLRGDDDHPHDENHDDGDRDDDDGHGVDGDEENLDEGNLRHHWQLLELGLGYNQFYEGSEVHLRSLDINPFW